MKYVVFLAVLSLPAIAQTPTARPAPLPATVIIPASDFIQEIPKGNIIADAGALRAPWIFNNTALVLKSKTNLMTRVQVPEAGTYTLYVRSLGEKNTAFKVAINDKVTTESFGRGPLSWQTGGTFALAAGPTTLVALRLALTDFFRPRPRALRLLPAPGGRLAALCLAQHPVAVGAARPSFWQLRIRSLG